MITISRREMVRAYRQHQKVYRDAQTPNNSHYLLLFYAVECGLKAILMRQQNISDTNELGPENNFGHNLNQCPDKLRINHRLRIPQGQIKARTARTVEPRQIHEVWRYGAKLENEANIVSRFDAIIAYIEKEIG